MIKKKHLLKVVCLGLLCGIIISASACGAEKPADTAAAPKQEAQQVKENIIEAAGTIKANNSKNIVLSFSASVDSVPVKEGQLVKQGDVLITLDINDIKQQILDLETNLNQAQLQLEMSVNDLSSSETELQRQRNQYNSEVSNSAGLKIKENDYKNAQVELNRIKADLEDKQELFDAGAVPEYDLVAQERKYEDAEKTLNDKKLLLDDTRHTRQQTLDKLQDGINQQTSGVKNLKLNIEIQKQKIKSLESDLAQLKDKLNKSYIKDNKIVSDYKNGLVKDLSPITGDPVQPNVKLLNLVDMDSLVVVADVPEDFIKDVKIGAEVEILPLSDSEKTYKGHVLKIADMGVDKNGETMVQTEISIDDKDASIKPNFSVDVRIAK